MQPSTGLGVTCREDFKGPQSQLTCSEQVHVISWLVTAPPCSALALRAPKVSAQDSHPQGCSQGEEEAANPALYSPRHLELPQKVCTGSWRAEVQVILLGVRPTRMPQPPGLSNHSSLTSDFAAGLSQRGRCRQGLLSSESGHSAPFTAQWENFQFSGTLQPVKAYPFLLPCPMWNGDLLQKLSGRGSRQP